MTTAATSAAAAPAQESLGRAVANTVKGSLGNLVEWFDVYTYTVFAPYFEGQFFNKADKNSTFYTMAIFAVTFVMRPIGSWFFGRWADRHGRKSGLTLSVTIMAAASLLVALMPTRGTIGWWAVLLLVLARLVQGFATGGEYGTSATYMSEAATRNRRGFLSSFQYVTLVGGQVLAQIVLMIMLVVMPEKDIAAWGWRIPFFIGGLAAVIVFWMRRTMDESLSDEKLEAIHSGEDTRSGSLVELLTNYWRPLILVFFLTLGGTVCFYTFSVNGPAMIKAAYKAHPQTATWTNLLCLVFLMALQPLFGLISDKIGRKPLLIWFGAGALVWAYVLIEFLPRQHNPWMSGLLLCVAFLFLSGYTSINALVKAEQFPAHIRALGVGLGYGLANALFGGTAPMVWDWAKNHHGVHIFEIYVTVCVAISLLVYIFALKNKYETHLDREQGHAYVR